MTLYISLDLKWDREFTNSTTKVFKRGTKLWHNSHDSQTKGNIQVHAGMIHIQNGNCHSQTVNE